MQQLTLPFDQKNQQSLKFLKLKQQADRIQDNIAKLIEASEFAQSVMRKSKNEIVYEMQKECRHQPKPFDWHEIETFYCPDCGKPL